LGLCGAAWFYDTAFQKSVCSIGCFKRENDKKAPVKRGFEDFHCHERKKITIDRGSLSSFLWARWQENSLKCRLASQALAQEQSTL